MQSNNIDDALRAQGITRGDELDSRTDVSGDVGGRIVRNKLWFYAGSAARAQRRHAGVLPAEWRGRATADDRQIFNTQKVSWQMTPSHRIVGVPHLPQIAAAWGAAAA